MEAPTVVLHNVAKTYDTPAGRHPALRDLDLEIGERQCVAITGKSGSGKSTLLHLIGGIDRATEGEVMVAGRRLARTLRRRPRALAGANGGRGLPVLPAPSHPDHGGERHAAHGSLRLPAAGGAAARPFAFWSSWAYATRRTSCPPPCPGDSSNGRP